MPQKGICVYYNGRDLKTFLADKSCTLAIALADHGYVNHEQVSDLDIVQWLRSQIPPCPWSAKTCEAAAIDGQLHVLKWLRSQNPPWRSLLAIVIYTCCSG